MGEKKRGEALVPWLWTGMICALVFLILVIVIRQPAIQAFDRMLIKSLDLIRTPELISFFKKITNMASSNFLFFLIALFMVYFLLRKKFMPLILLPAVFLIERYANSVLKHWVMRNRPPFPHLVHETGYSFPSGHAMNASTVYGLLILLMLPLIKTRWIRVAWAVVGLTLILLIGFSRPFLRVHYFTDIIAGYCAGGVLISLSAIALIFVYNRKR
ncbi:phosphatase PAP2 family protein [Sporolactobacillus sp. CPB3-1]|uniref:Phosphatase PAP2 family protein n=1 Tax=Sporolactobacillus mangiferae TaxID=2940498 RepID=A0ABT0M9Q2_9BACL|nr:phosphatase PAP2 family protein [Sporolactobacillus mangiferae]MCL1631075.1 phosphatase PAP2 family protein [Sporolactobacillus mangiferae]